MVSPNHRVPCIHSPPLVDDGSSGGRAASTAMPKLGAASVQQHTTSPPETKKHKSLRVVGGIMRNDTWSGRGLVVAFLQAPAPLLLPPPACELHHHHLFLLRELRPAAATSVRVPMIPPPPPRHCWRPPYAMRALVLQHAGCTLPQAVELNSSERGIWAARERRVKIDMIGGPCLFYFFYDWTALCDDTFANLDQSHLMLRCVICPV